MTMTIDIDASVAAASRQNAEGCVKIIEDLYRYRRVLDEVSPTLIIECGTFSGKSALWFANESGAPVITIDTNDQVSDDVKAAWAGRVTQFIGSSTSQQAYELVRSRVGDPGDNRTMVILDSDHSHPHVYDEMRWYGRFVPAGSFIVVEDTLLRWFSAEERAHYSGDPLESVQQWMTEHADEWTIDHEIEGMFDVTQHPSGWLRRTATPYVA